MEKSEYVFKLRWRSLNSDFSVSVLRFLTTSVETLKNLNIEIEKSEQTLFAQISVSQY